MVILTAEVIYLINVVTFVSFLFLAGLLLYLGRSTDPKKKITLPWINLSLGVILVGMGYLLQSSRVSTNITEDLTFFVSFISMIVGAMLTFASFALLYTQKVTETFSLREREATIKKIMKKLKEKYFKRELSEDELRKMHAELVRELTEIEVKLDKQKKKK